MNRIETGQMVFNEDGELLGVVTGMTEVGFEVKRRERSDSQGSDQEELPGQEFGEGYLMWRCGECGEMGKLEEGMPPICPNCGAPEEKLTAVEED